MNHARNNKKMEKKLKNMVTKLEKCVNIYGVLGATEDI